MLGAARIMGYDTRTGTLSAISGVTVPNLPKAGVPKVEPVRSRWLLSCMKLQMLMCTGNRSLASLSKHRSIGYQHAAMQLLPPVLDT